VLSEFEFLTEASHQLVEEWFSILGNDISRDTISVDDVCPDEVDNILFLNFFQRDRLYPLGEIISGC